MPAARKVCGFLAHSAYRGCSRCLLPFPTLTFGEKADYTNTDRSQWPPRAIESHKQHVLAYKACNTQAASERQNGVRYLTLNELPYFNPPRMCIIDPMHNLLFGTAKHMVEVWKSMKILTEKSFEDIQKRVDSFTTPNDLQYLQRYLVIFLGLQAEQWRNWTILFSLPALKTILPHRHYQCWHRFVKACYYLCRRMITSHDIDAADQLLMELYTNFVSLYGRDNCNPNLHLHGHLRECIRDYGPVYSF